MEERICAAAREVPTSPLGTYAGGGLDVARFITMEGFRVRRFEMLHPSTQAYIEILETIQEEWSENKQLQKAGEAGKQEALNQILDKCSPKKQQLIQDFIERFQNRGICRPAKPLDIRNKNKYPNVEYLPPHKFEVIGKASDREIVLLGRTLSRQTPVISFASDTAYHAFLLDELKEHPQGKDITMYKNI